MNIPDLVNGLFEANGALIGVFNIRKLLHDKKVLGIHWGTLAYFTSWGFYNLYYYPHLHQWLSFAGGAALVTTNAIWVSLVIWYQYVSKDRDRR